MFAKTKKRTLNEMGPFVFRGTKSGLVIGFLLYYSLMQRQFCNGRQLRLIVQNTLAAVDFHSYGDPMMPLHWKQTQYTGSDWWNQFVIHNSVTVSVSYEYLR